MDHLYLDIFGHISYAFILLVMYMISRKNKVGWVFRLIGQVGWLVLGFLTGFSSIWIWGFVFVVMDLYGYISWRKKDKLEKEITKCQQILK